MHVLAGYQLFVISVASLQRLVASRHISAKQEAPFFPVAGLWGSCRQQSTSWAVEVLGFLALKDWL